MSKEDKNKKDLERIVNESGHKLHTEVVEIVKNHKYKSEISPYYVDGYTDKPREIDIVARKRIPVYEDSEEYNVHTVLALDCKYLKDNVVFWSFENEKKYRALKMIGNEDELIRAGGENEFTYFKSSRVARLFQSGTSRTGNDPISDPIYKACVQTINGTIFAREHSGGPALIYPIVVVDGPGKLYGAENIQNELDSILVHLDYSYYPDRQLTKKPIREPFYVWIVRKEKLNQVLDSIQSETEIMKIQERDRIDEEFFKRHQ